MLLTQLAAFLLLASASNGAPHFDFGGPVLQYHRDTELQHHRHTRDANFDEIRQRLSGIASNVGVYSGKVQNGISQMDVHKNSLSQESANAVAEEKRLADEKAQIEAQIQRVTNAISAANNALVQLRNQENAENQNVANAANEVRHLEGQRPKRLCVWRCRKKWKRAQRKRIDEARRRQGEAEGRRATATNNRVAKENELNSLNGELANWNTRLQQNRAAADAKRKELLKSTNLTTMVQQLLKDLATLKVHVQSLRGELDSRKEFADEDLGFGWNVIDETLKRITDYLNNGGFKKDLQGWGIDITGFDAESIRKLGIDIDVSTRRVLNLQ